MVRIRLRRVGAKKQPSYRVVVADQRSPRDGRFIEMIGHYNPRTDPPTVSIDEERALYWLEHGAQPSAPVRRLLDKLGILAKVGQERAFPEPEPQGIEGPESAEEAIKEIAEAVTEGPEPTQAVEETAQTAEPIEGTAEEADVPVAEAAEEAGSPSDADQA